MRLRLNSLLFLLGVVLSLASLSVLGAVLVPPHLIGNFVRFHIGNGIDYNFFPTAHDIRAILDATEDPAAAVTVIVGGTSVFEGTSQSEPLIWTELLQKNLGKRFKVINLAQRAGRPNDFGNLAAEMLIKDGKPFIYLCDSMNAQFTIPIEASYYLKPVFDAWQRGYLLDWPARDRKMREALWSQKANFRASAWGALADSVLNFDGFWGYVTFEYGGTVWNKYRQMSSIVPLRDVKDPEPSPQWYTERGYPTGADDEIQMETARKQIFPPGSARWKAARADLEEQMPIPLRDKTFVVVNLNSPYYVDRLTEAERTAFLAQADSMAALIKSAGFHDAIVAAKDFTAADYSDRTHLSVEGGRKLADRVAPEIVRMAEEQGYVK